MPGIAHLESLLRACDGPGRIMPLLEALGLTGARPGGVAPGPALSTRTPATSGEELRGDVGGLHWRVLTLAEPASPAVVARLARAIRSTDPVHPQLLVAADPDWSRLTFASQLDGRVQALRLDRHRPRREDLAALHELAADGERGVALALRQARALERSGMTRRFFRDFRERRDAVAAAWAGLPAELDEQRNALALLFLSRLMFLYFLQGEGHLAGDRAFLPRLVRAAGAGTIYRARLQPLFFGSLNRRPEQRDSLARALGDLPYLNGGLFEPHAAERSAPDLDLSDDVVVATFDRLLDRYRFTAAECLDQDGRRNAEPGIEPEMLGRVFETLMEAGRRGETGTFYTPARAVEALTREAVTAYLTRAAALTEQEAGKLAAGQLPPSFAGAPAARAARCLEGLRVLDPACGSGAFLLGAYRAVSRARESLVRGDSREIRRDTVARVLHGVDVQADAALLCELRLWLALAQRPTGGDPRTPAPPLPNLDMRVRQGDALLDPMDLLLAESPGRRPAPARRAVRAAVARIPPLAQRFLTAEPGEKEHLRAELREAELALADAWLGEAAERLGYRRRELAAGAAEIDLFGKRTLAALDAERGRREAERVLGEIDRLRRRLQDEGSLPFFSFAVHFAEVAEHGFDIVLSNPPWLRAHRWPPTVRQLVRERYEVSRRPGWRRGAALGGAPEAAGAQVDLAMLFLERSLRLLAGDGVLGMVLPAKMIRSLYGAGGRRLMLRQTELVSVHDHSLDQHAIFRADAFAATIVARRRGSDAPPDTAPQTVRLTMTRRRVPPLSFVVCADALPLVPGDDESPWLLAPPAAAAALRRMQACPALAEDGALRVRRGVFTGANDCLLVDAVEAKLGGLAEVRAQGARARASWLPEGTTRERRTDVTRPEAWDRADLFEAVVEQRALAPAVRGSGLGAWRFDVGPHVLWLHDDETGEARPAPLHASRYLDRHESTLLRRHGARRGAPAGALLRVTADTLRPKLAWRDLAQTLEAVALPARVDGPAGRDRPLVPLNTVYFIPLPSAAEALLLSAYFNSLPVRTFARSIAERAKDARFRFFAWVVALLPLPTGWRSGQVARRLLAIAKSAHAAGGIADAAREELDETVARAYRLTREHVSALREFDCWLRGVS